MSEIISPVTLATNSWLRCFNQKQQFTTENLPTVSDEASRRNRPVSPHTLEDDTDSCCLATSTQLGVLKSLAPWRSHHEGCSVNDLFLVLLTDFNLSHDTSELKLMLLATKQYVAMPTGY